MTRVHSPMAWDPRYSTHFYKILQDLEPLGFRLFETYRSDEEQLRVFNLGTSKARPGESPHQWGLAADFVPYHPENGFFWPKANSAIWQKMHAIVDRNPILSKKAGPDIRWDSPHVEVVNWRALRSESHRQSLRKHFK